MPNEKWVELSLEEKNGHIHDLLEGLIERETSNIEARNQAFNQIGERLRSIDDSIKGFRKELHGLQGKKSLD